MHIKMKIAIIIGILAAFLVMPIEAQAKAVTKQQQILFIKEHLPVVLEKEEVYGIPYELALAQGAWESKYGTSEFASKYHNLTGYDCYPDSEDGPVVCHKKGQFSSYEECWDAYFSLLADKYGKRDAYNNAPKQLVAAIADTYCPGSTSYASDIGGMIDRVRMLEGEIVAMQSLSDDAAGVAEEREAAVALSGALARLGDEKIYVINEDAPLKNRGLVAGATAVTSVSLKEVTVQEAANKVLASSSFRDFAERKKIMGSENYAKVQEYLRLQELL